MLAKVTPSDAFTTVLHVITMQLHTSVVLICLHHQNQYPSTICPCIKLIVTLVMYTKVLTLVPCEVFALSPTTHTLRPQCTII